MHTNAYNNTYTNAYNNAFIKTIGNKEFSATFQLNQYLNEQIHMKNVAPKIPNEQLLNNTSNTSNQQSNAFFIIWLIC